MLDELKAKNVALIKEASISPAPGLTAITGETGSGKTAFLSALKLLVGERAGADMVREGQDELLIEARLFTGVEQEEHILKRSVSKDGRSRVTIDDDIEPVKALAETAGVSIDLCGQHEHQKLLDVASHVALLDAWAKDAVAEPLRAYQEALQKKKEAAAALAEIKKASRAGSEKLAQATYEVERIEEARPSQEELDELEKTLPKAEHAGKLVEFSSEAHAALSDEAGAIDSLQIALSAFKEAAALDADLEGKKNQLEAATREIEDVAATLRDYAANIDIDAARLSQMQDRQATLQALMRTFGPTMRNVLERLAAAKAIVATVNNSDEAVAAAEQALARARENLQTKAGKLNEARKEVAPRFVQAVTNEMAKLEMGTASLEMQFTPLDEENWTETGPSRIEFMYCPAENLSSKPFKKVASGGEVSRVMLAIKAVAGAADEVETLVFDEVDAGVGGHVALALAQVLKELSKTHQILCVTHLPQVASVADKHYIVEKTEGATSNAGGAPSSSAEATTTVSIPETTLTEVEGEARAKEIARMLSGEVTEISLSHAKTLLSS